MDTTIKDPDVFEQQYHDSGGYDARTVAFAALVPRIDKSYGGLDQFVFINMDTLSASRLGNDDILLTNPLLKAPATLEAGELTGVKKINNSTSWSLSYGIGGEFGSFTHCHTETESHTVLDYTDMNGDRYPDVLGENSIQFTKPTGGLGSLSSAEDASTFTKSSNDVKYFRWQVLKNCQATSDDSA
jgi:hypothetical protein